MEGKETDDTPAEGVPVESDESLQASEDAGIIRDLRSRLEKTRGDLRALEASYKSQGEVLAARERELSAARTQSQYAEERAAAHEEAARRHAEQGIPAEKARSYLEREIFPRLAVLEPPIPSTDLAGWLALLGAVALHAKGVSDGIAEFGEDVTGWSEGLQYLDRALLDAGYDAPITLDTEGETADDDTGRGEDSQPAPSTGGEPRGEASDES